MDLCAEEITRNYINQLCILDYPSSAGKSFYCVACLPVIIKSIVSYYKIEYSSDCATNDGTKPVHYSQ
jgi:hypothetical protein